MTTRVIILAAGRGSRMGGLTEARPKGLVELRGRAIVEWQIAALRAAGVNEIHIATGYRPDMFEHFDLPTVHNPDWAETNMVSTLLCARTLLESSDDLVVSYSDIVYEPRVISAILGAKGDIATVIDLKWLQLWNLRSDDPLSDAETLRLRPDGSISEIGNKPKALDEIQGQYIGLSKFTGKGKRILLDFVARAGTPAWPYQKPLARIHFTDLLQGLIGSGEKVMSAPVEGGWVEVDTERDLAAYEMGLRNGTLDLKLPRTTAGARA